MVAAKPAPGPLKLAIGDFICSFLWVLASSLIAEARLISPSFIQHYNQTTVRPYDHIMNDYMGYDLTVC